MVKEKLNEPAVTDAGESELMVGTPSDSGKVTRLDSPPPGAGFSTQT